MVNSVRLCLAGAKGVLQATVEEFYQPVGLRVVGSSLVVLDVEQAAEGGPQGGGELGPARGPMLWLLELQICSPIPETMHSSSLRL